MKILHVDETFHPAFGYQVNPLAKFQQKQGNEVYIVTPVKEYMHSVYRDFGDDGSKLDEQDKVYHDMTGVTIVRIPAKGHIMGRLVYGKEIFETIDKIDPDVLMVHCIETLTAIRLILRRQKYPVVFDSHMLSMASRNRFVKAYEFFYKLLVTSKVNRRRNTVIRTQDDDYVSSHLGIDPELTPFVSFGTDTLLFCKSQEAREQFRKENNIPEDEFVVIYTGKLTEAKGGLLMAEAFQKKFPKPVTLVCVGSIKEDAYGLKVKETLEKSENRIILFPTQNYLDLAKYYQMADLSIFPKQCSMSFYDAQACGLPVLSEDNNINVDRCSHNNGVNFISGDAEDMRARIIEMASMSKEQWNEYSDNAIAFIREGYDYSVIAEKYTEYLKKAMADWKK